MFQQVFCEKHIIRIAKIHTKIKAKKRFSEYKTKLLDLEVISKKII